MSSQEFSRRELLAAAGAMALAAAVGTSPVVLGAAASPAPSASPARALPRRALGRTGVQVGILGLGADGVVTDGTGDEAAELISEALDAGVNFLDTAYMYGKDGASEKNLGLVMAARRRPDAFLATKTGSRTYDGAMRQVETSLQRLRTDHLDLIQVHHVSDKDDVPAFAHKNGVIAALRKLQSQKVVRFIGMTGHSQDAAVLEALKLYEWDTFMCFANPARFSDPARQQQLPLAAKKGMGIIGMKVFGGRPGSLVGAGRGQADAASLLRYAWSQPVSLVLTGVSSRQQFRENLEAARRFAPMTADEVAALSRRINNTEKPWQRA